MKLNRYFCLGVFAMLSVIFAGLLLAQDKPAKDSKPGKDAPPLNMEEMTRK